MPIKSPEFEANDKHTGMTVAELAAFIDSAKAAHAPDDAVVEVTTKGVLHPRITVVKVRTSSTK